FSVSGSHTYAEEGSFSVVVSIHDLDNQNYTINSTATVRDASLVPAAGTNNLTLQLSKGIAFNGTVGSFQDQDPQGIQSDYTASIKWGDGSSSTGNVTLGGGSFQVNGNHTYAEPGTYTILTTVTDHDASLT